MNRRHQSSKRLTERCNRLKARGESFTDLSEAIAARLKRVSAAGEVLNVYSCPTCGEWHIGRLKTVRVT